jgi:hypothetical protein
MKTTNTLMGTSYEMAPIIQPSTPTPTLRRVVETVDPALAIEEQRIGEIRQQEYRSDAPVLSAQDPSVRSANFRNPAIAVEPGQVAETLRRARVERSMQQDAPVEPRPAPLVISAPEPALPQIERYRRFLRAEESIVPVQRKTAVA